MRKYLLIGMTTERVGKCTIHPTNSFYGHSDQNEIVQGNLRVKYVPCPRGIYYIYNFCNFSGHQLTFLALYHGF